MIWRQHGVNRIRRFSDSARQGASSADTRIVGSQSSTVNLFECMCVNVNVCLCDNTRTRERVKTVKYAKPGRIRLSGRRVANCTGRPVIRTTGMGADRCSVAGTGGGGRILEN
jgi:hypothetical protein